MIPARQTPEIPEYWRELPVKEKHRRCRGMRLSGLPLSTRREKVRFPARVRTKHSLESCQIHDLSLKNLGSPCP
jgi:hypothetical protein